MKGYAFPAGEVRYLDFAKRENKGAFGIDKMFWDFLNKNHVAFFNTCCEEATDSPSPVRNNDGVLESFNGTAWVAIDLGTFTATDIALDDGLVSDLAIKIGADANNGIYGISDTQLGFAVEGVLVGGANTTGLFTDSIVEQTTSAGVTVAGALIKSGGISANSMFAGFFPTTAAQALSGAGAVNITSYLTKYTSTGASQALSLASGSQIGQRKKISHVVDGGSGVLTAVFVGGTNITFTTVAEFAELIWTGSAWGVLELGNSATPGTPPALA